MLRKTSKRVTFSPDVTEKPKPATVKWYHVGISQNARTAWKKTKNLSSSDLPKNPMLGPLKFLRRVGDGASRAICSLFRKPAAGPRVVTPRVSSSHGDFHHNEAIEDCIEFINSSLSRSNSVSDKLMAEQSGRLPTNEQQQDLTEQQSAKGTSNHQRSK